MNYYNLLPLGSAIIEHEHRLRPHGGECSDDFGRNGFSPWGVRIPSSR